jgi:Raf kinase inhibitor-like YbhB/YbcL family protein
MKKSPLIPALVFVTAVTFMGSGCSKEDDVPATQLRATALSQTQPNLTITSPDFSEGGTIPDEFSSYGANKTPRIKWSNGPTGTRSYVLLLEDPDAPGSKPFVHWLLINIPAKDREAPGSGLLLNNQNGDPSYYGPHPPPGSAHHYIFQVFALDQAEITASDRDSTIAAMKGHILGKGQMTALYQKK